MKRLSHYGLVEYDNQNKEGYETATYVRITTSGIYYLERLISTFSYSELMFGDTPISDKKIVKELKDRTYVDHFRDKWDRLEVRFERTELFLDYLKRAEENEFEINHGLFFSDLTKTRFMDKILAEYLKKKYIKDAHARRLWYASLNK